jgi:hypothetical protein
MLISAFLRQTIRLQFGMNRVVFMEIRPVRTVWPENGMTQKGRMETFDFLPISSTAPRQASHQVLPAPRRVCPPIEVCSDFEAFVAS